MANTVDKSLYAYLHPSDYMSEQDIKLMRGWPSLYYTSEDGGLYRMIWLDYLVRFSVSAALRKLGFSDIQLLYEKDLVYTNECVSVVQRALACIENNMLRHDSLNALSTMPLFSIDEQENHTHFVAYIVNSYNEMEMNFKNEAE